MEIKRDTNDAKGAHVRVTPQVRDELNAIVKEQGLESQCDAIVLGLKRLKQASSGIPEKEHAVKEITELLGRIVDIVENCFYVISDAKADYKAKADALENDYSHEISRLEDENHELRQRCSSYENIFKIMGIKPAIEGKITLSDASATCPSEASGPSEQGHDIANTQPQEKVPDKNLKD